MFGWLFKPGLVNLEYRSTEESSGKKVNEVKALRAVFGCGLNQSKKLVDCGIFTIAEKITRKEADEIISFMREKGSRAAFFINRL